MKSEVIDGLRPVTVEDSPMFQPRHLTCKACGGTGRNRTTGGACRACSKGRLNATGAKGEPMKLRKPGEPSGWNQNGEYRTEDRRVALHRALDRVMDARGLRQVGSKYPQAALTALAKGDAVSAVSRKFDVPVSVLVEVLRKSKTSGFYAYPEGYAEQRGRREVGGAKDADKTATEKAFERLVKAGKSRAEIIKILRATRPIAEVQALLRRPYFEGMQ